LGDKQAIISLTEILEDSNDEVRAAAAVALAALDTDQDYRALTKFLDHSSSERRRVAVKQLVKLRDKPKENILLSHDLDGLSPWIDPETPITEQRIADAAQRLEISTQEARYLYEAIAADFHLRFA
jgi:HEAT repeat protein